MVRHESLQQTDGATAQLAWALTAPVIPADAWTPAYFVNPTTLKSPAAHTVNENAGFLPPSRPPDKRPFTGSERDHETGQDYFEARYLRGGAGRFTTVDPLASSGYTTNPQSWNRYTFGLNNPLRIGDPFGLEPTEYYDKDGKWLGTDGVDNGVFSLITNPKTAGAVASQQKASGQVDPGAIPVGDHIDLGPLDRAVVGWVYDNTGTNSEAAAATGFYGQAPGLLGTVTTVGSPADPGQDAKITLPDMTGMDQRLVAHGHPGATDGNGDPVFRQEPSEDGRHPDIPNGVVLGAVNVVVGKQSRMVYFYNSQRTYATVPIGKVTNLSRR